MQLPNRSFTSLGHRARRVKLSLTELLDDFVGGASSKEALMASYRQYPSTAAQPNGERSDEIALGSKVGAKALRARAARYRHLASALVDPRVISEVLACAIELDAEAAKTEREPTFSAPFLLNPEVTRIWPVR